MLCRKFELSYNHFIQCILDIENLKNMESKEEQLSLELLWATVKECEGKVAKTNESLNKEERRIAAIQRKVSISDNFLYFILPPPA